MPSSPDPDLVGGLILTSPDGVTEFQIGNVKFKITSPTNGQEIIYNGTDGKFENTTSA